MVFRAVGLGLLLSMLPATVLGTMKDDAAGEAPVDSLAQLYGPQAHKIITTVMAGNDAWSKLEELCDDIGHRLSGSPQLEQAIEWAVKTLEADGHDNVHTEAVEVPHWVRGDESLTMIAPRPMEIAMLGLGGSVGTPSGGLTAEVVVVKDEKELESIGDAARGKIVLFNYPMRPYTEEHGPGYGDAVRFRTHGARWASQQGAVASLVRSVTATSLQNPHTGAMRYGDAAVKIPSAAITIEAADMLDRLTKRGIKPIVNLKMEAKTLEPAMSANVIAEIRGSTWPDQVVIISGHFDSWDVGHGAHDDGGPCVAAMEALNVLRKLDMIPKRTIRVVLWTNEENGLNGAKQYAKDHEQELTNHVAAIEMDSGVFAPRGYSLDCSDEQRAAQALKQLEDITSLFSEFGADHAELGGSGADLGPMRASGVVLMGHRVDISHYFDFHHSPADTIDKIDPGHLSQNVAVMAVTAYILADMPGRLGELPGR